MTTPPTDAPLPNCLSLASFRTPEFMTTQSAWTEHAPFAFWLIDALRPKVIVELGCYHGFSYFAFCQGAQALGIGTRCYAVDHWKGDEHAGFYDDRVFQQVSAYNARRYNSFSTLIRTGFDEAAQHFERGSIDLLHIDGAHFYDAVKHDFETWKPLLSASGIILFHDTNVRERDFGVWKLWAELERPGQSFQFLHGYGLGVLAMGDHPCAALKHLLGSEGGTDACAIRQIYGRLGRGLADAVRQEELAQAKQELDKANARLSEWEALQVQIGAVRRRYRSPSASIFTRPWRSLKEKRKLSALLQRFGN